MVPEQHGHVYLVRLYNIQCTVYTHFFKELAVSNTNENIAKVAKEFGEAVQYETRMAEQEYSSNF